MRRAVAQQPLLAKAVPPAAADNGLLAHQSLSDRTLGRFAWWIPPVPDWEAVRSPNSSLRIAAIVGERLYHGLRFEGELLLLTPANWRQVLRYGELDLLLVESAWRSATGHWNMAQSAPGLEAQDLQDLVAVARAMAIPSAYWFTADRLYHHHYRDTARLFDRVFCADPGEAELLAQEGVEAEVLPPCVQPALYNPFRVHQHHDALELGVLFDGWGDLDRRPEAYEVLKEVAEEHRLDIIESRYLLTRDRVQAQGDLSACIHGCTARSGRLTALKYAQAYLSFEISLSTSTTQQWRALEASASYLPQVHFGVLAEGDIRSKLMLSHGSEDAFLSELYRLKRDELYRKRCAHRSWRETLLHHTFSHRLRNICQSLGVAHDWVEYPKASLITPSYRIDKLPGCLDTFQRQSYPNKEWILVFNGPAPPAPEALGLAGEGDEIHVTHVPGDFFAGACLNRGQQIARGDYCFRIDDDDLYGDNYILDLMLSQRAFEADVFGKMPSPLFFEGEQQVHLRPQRFKPWTCADGSLFREGRLWIGGNSVSHRRNAVPSDLYANNVLGAADSVLNLNVAASSHVAIADDFNIAAERRDDLSSHTWRKDLRGVASGASHRIYKEDLII